MVKSEFAFFNMEENMSLSAQAPKLAQSRFEYRPKSFNTVDMHWPASKLILSIKDFGMVLKSILHQGIIDSKAISIDR